MKYLMLIYGNEEIWGSVDDFAGFVGRVDAFNQALRESGELVDVAGLVSTPKAVTAKSGAPVVTDGPYLEAKEHVGSYFVVDVEGPDRALEIATSYPGLAGGGLECWPLMTQGCEADG